MSGSLAVTRWKPPAMKWMRGLIALADSTILSIPGCEHPTTMTMPSGVLKASDSSRSSSVPGLSETSVMMDARCDLRVLVDELKISARPSRAKPHDFWWCTVVVALLRWERRVFAIEAAWQIRAIDAETFLRGVDRHFGVHLQEVG